MDDLHKAGTEPCSDRLTTSPQISILFVCLGNICKPPPSPLPATPHPAPQLTTHPLPPTGRSPMAEAVFRSLLPTSSTNSRIDSAGTAAYHTGSPPDPRTVSVLEAHGITDYTHRARMIRSEDFEEFDYILAMDGENLENLERARERAFERRGKEEGEGRGKVRLFGEFGGKGAEEVVDPYYGESGGFEVAFEQIVRFSKGFLRRVGGGEVG